MKHNAFTFKSHAMAQHAQLCSRSAQLHDSTNYRVDCATIVFDVNTRQFSEEYASYAGMYGTRCEHKSHSRRKAKITMLVFNMLQTLHKLNDYNFDNTVANLSVLLHGNSLERFIKHVNVITDLQTLLQHKFHLLQELTQVDSTYNAGITYALEPGQVNCIRVMVLRNQDITQGDHCVAVNLLNIDTEVHNLLYYQFDIHAQHTLQTQQICRAFNMSIVPARGITYNAYEALSTEQHSIFSSEVPVLFSSIAYVITASCLGATALQCVRNLCLEMRNKRAQRNRTATRVNNMSLIDYSGSNIRIVDIDDNGQQVKYDVGDYKRGASARGDYAIPSKSRQLPARTGSLPPIPTALRKADSSSRGSIESELLLEQRSGEHIDAYASSASLRAVDTHEAREPIYASLVFDKRKYQKPFAKRKPVKTKTEQIQYAQIAFAPSITSINSDFEPRSSVYSDILPARKSRTLANPKKAGAHTLASQTPRILGRNTMSLQSLTNAQRSASLAPQKTRTLQHTTRAPISTPRKYAGRSPANSNVSTTTQRTKTVAARTHKKRPKSSSTTDSQILTATTISSANDSAAETA